MTQQPLDFARTHTKRGQPASSIEAAESVAGAAQSLKRRIYAELVKSGRPMANEELARRMGLQLYQVRRRMSDLRESGHVEPSGDYYRNDAGRRTVKWRLTQ